MQRIFEDTLKVWKSSGMNKPLIIIGARQIGKTYTIEKFCKENFENYLYFNLEKDVEIAKIFENTLKPEEIIKNIEVRLEKTIDIDNTIMFFDEVQVSEKFITSLKYFCESTNNYKIICAGSLLGVKLNRFNSSFPVGKVEIPLKAYLNNDIFKIYYSDVGILNSICDIGINDIINDSNFMFKGAIAENYIAEELTTMEIPLIYWKSKGDAEIDFLLTTKDGIIPIEVKASDRVQSKSLNIYMEKYKPTYGIRISMKNFGFENDIKSIPLYAAFCLSDLRN